MWQKLKLVSNIVWLGIVLVGAIAVYFFFRSSGQSSQVTERAERNVRRLKDDLEEAQRFLNTPQGERMQRK